MSVPYQPALKMLPPEETRYTKLRWLWTIVSLLLYMLDIVTDLGLVLNYLLGRQFLWAALTLVFVLVGLVATQVFSYAWYIDDMNDASLRLGGKPVPSRLFGARLVSVHVLGIGIFTRYIQLLKAGRRELWPPASAPPVEEKEKEKEEEEEEEEERVAHHRLFCLATDLSMLKLFEAFLESVPQLLLQISLLLHHGEGSLTQLVSMAFSFVNAAWALVDYRHCLRRSLPGVQDMPGGLPTAVYLLYKLGAVTSRVLAYALLLSLSAYTAAALVALWLLGTLWAHLLRTDFCTRRSTEWAYRAVVGAVLTFTFFNVKGRRTRTPMSVYYLLHAAVNAAAPLLFAALWSPPSASASATTPATELWWFWAVTGVIAAGTAVGLVCLVVYYGCMHPAGRRPAADEEDQVDGPGAAAARPTPRAGGKRMRAFLQP